MTPGGGNASETPAEIIQISKANIQSHPAYLLDGTWLPPLQDMRRPFRQRLRQWSLITAIVKKRYRWLGRPWLPFPSIKSTITSVAVWVRLALTLMLHFSPHPAYLLLSLKAKSRAHLRWTVVENPPIRNESGNACSKYYQRSRSLREDVGRHHLVALNVSGTTSLCRPGTSTPPHSHCYRGPSRSPRCFFPTLLHPSLRNP